MKHSFEFEIQILTLDNNNIMHLLQSCSIFNTCLQVDRGTSCYSDGSCGKGIVSRMSRERFSGAHHNIRCAELFLCCIFNEKSFDCRRVYLSWCPCVVELLLLLTLFDLGGGRKSPKVRLNSLPIFNVK